MLKFFNLFSKKILLIFSTLVLALVIVGTVLIFWLRSEKFDAWNLIPESAVVVLETQDFPTTFRKLEKQGFWQIMQENELFSQFSSQFRQIEKIIRQEDETFTFWENKTFTLSLHPVSKDEFSTLLLFPLDPNNDRDIFRKVIQRFEENEQVFTYRKRNFQGYEIEEITYNASQKVFSFSIYKGFVMASFSPLLLDDAIRNMSQNTNKLRFSEQKEAKEFLTEENQHFRLYFNPKALPSFMRILVNSQFADYFDNFTNFSEGFYFDVDLMKSSNEKLAFTGKIFSNPKDTSQFINILQGQAPSSSFIKEYIPSSTALFYHFSFDNVENLTKSLQTFYHLQNPDFESKQKQIEKKYKFEFQDFYTSVKNEIALVILESGQRKELDKVIFLKTKNNSRFKRLLAKLNTENIRQNYLGQSIFNIAVSEFPAIVFGNTFTGFSDCFVAEAGEYILLGNDLSVLKKTLTDIKNHKVWSRENSKMTKYSKQKANFKFILNIAKFWNVLYKNASPFWQKFLSAYEKEIKKINYFTFQLTHIEAGFEGKLALELSTEAANYAPSPKKINHKLVANLPNAIYTKVFRVENHNNNQEELVLQDYRNRFWLISNQGKALWNSNTGGPMRSKIYQIDWLRNGKLQYAFMTSSRLNLIDRNGRSVKGFPMFMPDTNALETMSYFEMENKHHFLISDVRGNLYLIGDKRKRIKGWTPRKLRYRLGTPAKHCNIQGKDYIIVAEANGYVHLFDKAGKEQAGFPLRIPARISNELLLNTNTSLANTTVTLLTDNNGIVEFNLAGKITRKVQLERTSTKAKFVLCPNQNQTAWLLGSIDTNLIQVFDNQGKKLFRLPFGNPEKFEIQYFTFINNQAIIAVTDREEAETYFYNTEGEAISENLSSTQKVDIQYDEIRQKFLIYKVYNREISIVELD